MKQGMDAWLESMRRCSRCGTDTCEELPCERTTLKPDEHAEGIAYVGEGHRHFRCSSCGVEYVAAAPR